MEAAAQEVPPFRLELTESGVFPDLRQVRVVWVGLGGELDRLRLLQQRLESNVSPMGFPAEARAFTPHLTLARLREGALPAERQRVGQLIAGTRLDTGCDIKVDSISLIKSELTRQGAICTQISSAKLKSIL